MPAPNSLEATTPALSIQLLNFSAKDPGRGGWHSLLAQARACDEAGIDRVVASDHVVMGENLEEYGNPKVGGTQGGQQPTGPDGQWLDPLTLLSVVAGATTNCRLMTGILIAALRRPAVLAKSLSTLDVLSEGRLDIGVGVGWQREEYEACGLEFEGRGKRLNQTLEVCQTLWSQESASYHSDDLHFEGIHTNPKPLQEGGIPFWISGTINKSVLARIARFGSGWIPWGPDAMNPTEGLRQIREVLEDAGRSTEGFQVTSYVPVATNDDRSLDLGKTMAAVGPMIDAGITDVRATLPVPTEYNAALDYLSPIVEAFRNTVGR